MPEEQLRFFDPARPLLQHFGVEFFRSVPTQPGVYVMFDRHGRIIYVGQSVNLRARLSSYKYVYPGRASRKTVRLVHAVQKIVWEECGTVEAARLRENYLLRAHRPKFNSANTYPPAYFFLRLRATSGELHLALTREIDLKWFNYGAFKSGCAAAYGALLRTLWARSQLATQPAQFPMGFLSGRPPRAFIFPLREGDETGLLRDLRAFLSGEAETLVEELRRSLATLSMMTCLRSVCDQDLDLLQEFFRRGPARHRWLRSQLALGDGPIAPHELDDALIFARGPDTLPGVAADVQFAHMTHAVCGESAFQPPSSL